MKKSFNGICFQCNKNKTTIKAFIDDDHKGYFCNLDCLQEYLKKGDIDTVRSELTTIVGRWGEEPSYNPWYACVCGLLLEGEQQAIIISKTQALFMISKSKDEEKLRGALKYVKTVGTCVIL